MDRESVYVTSGLRAKLPEVARCIGSIEGTSVIKIKGIPIRNSSEPLQYVLYKYKKKVNVKSIFF